MSHRIAQIERQTLETEISVSLNLDAKGISDININVPFFEHLLDQVSHHSLIDLNVIAKGDLHVDAHHTIEDVGITLGQCLAKAVGDKRGICRYGHAYVPLDESLSRVVLDFSGRPGLEYNVEFASQRVGDFDLHLIREFFQGLVNHANLTLHIDNLKGRNAHHQAETIFKAFGRALRMALAVDIKIDKVPSTKGVL